MRGEGVPSGTDDGSTVTGTTAATTRNYMALRGADTSLLGDRVLDQFAPWNWPASRSRRNWAAPQTA